MTSTDANLTWNFTLGIPFIWQMFTWHIGTFIIHACTRFTIYGRENLDEAIRIRKQQKIGIIFAGNHTSDMDGILMLSAVKPLSTLFPIYYVGRTYVRYQWENWRKWIYQDWFFRTVGVYPVREGMGDYEKSLQTHIELLEMGKTVAIFPEGKIVRDVAPMPEPRGGVAYMAQRVQTVVVPIFVEGDFDIQNFLRKDRPALSIYYGKPLQLADIFEGDDYSDDRYKHAAQNIMEKVYTLRDVHSSDG